MKTQINKAIASVMAVSLASLPVVASAAVPQAFTDAVTDFTTDGALMAGALVGVAAAVQIVLLAVNYVKKLRGTAK